MTDPSFLGDERLFTPLRGIHVSSECLVFCDKRPLDLPACDWRVSEACYSGRSSEYLCIAGRFAEWRYIPATLSDSREKWGSSSTSVRVPRCSSLRSVGVSRHPAQSKSSGTQSIASIRPAVLGWTLTNSWPGLITSISWERNGADAGRFGISPKLEECPFHHKWNAAV